MAAAKLSELSDESPEIDRLGYGTSSLRVAAAFILSAILSTVYSGLIIFTLYCPKLAVLIGVGAWRRGCGARSKIIVRIIGCWCKGYELCLISVKQRLLKD